MEVVRMRPAGWLVGVVLVVCSAVAHGREVPFKAGDIVTVKVRRASIREGRQEVGALRKGTRVKLYDVRAKGGFALIKFTLRGKVHEGYVRLSDLEPPVRKKKGEAEQAKGPLYSVDDEVTVVVEKAKLKKGKKTLGLIPEGTRLMVRKVRGNWLGVRTKVNGKSTFGWVHSRDVDHALSDAEPPPGSKKDGKK